MQKNYDSGEAIGGSVALKPLSIAIDTTFTCVLGHNKQDFAVQYSCRRPWVRLNDKEQAWSVLNITGKRMFAILSLLWNFIIH